MTDEIKQMIDNEIKGKVGVGTRTVAKILAVKFSQEGREWAPKRSTIKSYVKSTSWGNKSYRLRRRPFLSEKNKDDRRKFCKYVSDNGYLDTGTRGQEKTSHVLYTDESMVQLCPPINTQNIQIRCQNSQDVPVDQVIRNPLSVMIAEGI